MNLLQATIKQARRFVLRLIYWRRRNARYVIILGGPGAGKGTMANRLAPALGLPKLSMGDAFRREHAAGTEVGLKAWPYVSTGKLVPDELTTPVLVTELDQPKYINGTIIDGLPRTFPQAVFLDGHLDGWGLEVERVIMLDVPEADLIERLSHRRTCSNKLCGRTYHLVMQPPAEAGKCDACGHALYQREDDNPEAIRERLAIFAVESKPIRDYYKAKGLLTNVQSTNAKGIDAVFAEVLSAVKG